MTGADFTSRGPEGWREGADLPGQPITRQVFAELDKRGIDWVCDEVRSGRSVVSIAEELGVGRGLVYKWVKADRDRLAQFREARADSAHAHVEDAGELLDSLADQNMSAPEVRLAEARAGHRRWLAERYNREEYGQPEPQTVVQIGELYLGALRRWGGASQLPVVDAVPELGPGEGAESVGQS